MKFIYILYYKYVIFVVYRRHGYSYICPFHLKNLSSEGSVENLRDYSDVSNTTRRAFKMFMSDNSAKKERNYVFHVKVSSHFYKGSGTDSFLRSFRDCIMFQRFIARYKELVFALFCHVDPISHNAIHFLYNQMA